VSSITAFRKGLTETGFTEGRNVVIEYRWANDRSDRLPALAAELVDHRVAVIYAPGGSAVGLAAKAATTTIPIIFGTGGDPVQARLVRSLNRPGGNVTGIAYMNNEVIPKRVGLLHELAPKATRFVMLLNPSEQTATSASSDAARTAVTALGRELEILNASNNAEINQAFAVLTQKRADALLIGPGQVFFNRRVQVITLANRYGAPAIYFHRGFADIGGLISYGPDFIEQSRLGGVYVGRVLKGEKPDNLPVMRPNKFEFVINVGTARALGIEVPQSLLAIADEVIE
jgi:putative ABC transport system substrate-binding protein